MYRKEPRRSPYQRGRPVVRFRTDDQDRRRVSRRYAPPISRGTKSLSIPKSTIKRVKSLEPEISNNLEKPLLQKTISYVLRQAPIASELYVAYSLADAIYNNWSTIMHLHAAYKKGGAQEVANTIATDAVHDELSSFQTDAVWATVGRFIPLQYQDTGKQILASVIGMVTTAEIKLAKQFLPPTRSPPHHAHGARSMQIGPSEAPYHKESGTKRLPKEVGYV